MHSVNMIKKGSKRKTSAQENDTTDSRKEVKRGKKDYPVSGECSKDIVKEFSTLTSVKQTRLKGFKQFLTTIKKAEVKNEIISIYLQSHPDCSEMFDVLKESPEQRSVFEVQVVLEIFEVIILQLVGGDIRTKTQATAIVSIFLANHRKLVYNCLNSTSPSNVTIAMLRLLTAFVMHGQAITRELLTTFDFSHKTFGTLVNRRDKKSIADVRTCFIKFVLSLFVTGDASLVHQILHIRGFATSILKSLHKDSAEVIQLVLSTLLAKVVQNSSILKKNKILLFTSHSLSQLAKLYSYETDSSIRETVHLFLLELCTSKNGIAFDNKQGIFSVGSNNPVLLRFLHSLPKTLDDDLLIELIIRILQNSQDLVSPYLTGYQMALEPRNSQQWINNFVFLIKLYFHLPMPSTVLNVPSISPDQVASSGILRVLCPENLKRSILTRGLQHPDVVIQGTTLSMLLVILKRSCNMQLTNIDNKMPISFSENILKLLPSFQVLISIRENLSKRTKQEESVKDHSTPLSIEEATIILSRILACMRLYQIISPHCFIMSNYDPWKLLPRNPDEELFFNVSSKYSMLKIFLRCPSQNFKWHAQSKTDTAAYFRQVLQMYHQGEDSFIQRMTEGLLHKFLVETGVCDFNKDEVPIWLHNILDGCIDDRGVIAKFFEKMYCRLASDPFELVDAVIDSVQGVSLKTHLAVANDLEKRCMPYTPIVPCALEFFVREIKDDNGQNSTPRDLDILARYINLVILDILELQADPRPLCNLVMKMLVRNSMVPIPLHMRILLEYISCWTTVEIAGEQKLTKMVKSLSRKGISNEQFGLSPEQFNDYIITTEHIDVSFVVGYLKCNPVAFLDSKYSTGFLVLSKLPSSLVLRQLWMFVMKHWNSTSAFSTNVELLETFKAIVDVILLVVTEEKRESWERTVSSALWLATNVVNMSSEIPGDKLFFTEIMRTITEVLRITYDQLRSETNGVSCDDKRVDDVTNNSDVNYLINDDDFATDVIHSDVINVIDRTCAKNGKVNVQDNGRLSARLMKKVFVQDTFIKMYCTSNSAKDDPWLRHVYGILSNCISYLMVHFREEILEEQNYEYLNQYFIRISQAVKENAFRQKIADEELPYKVSTASLFKMFHKYFPDQVFCEIFQNCLAFPKEHFMEENVLSTNGETLIDVVECFLEREEAHLSDTTPTQVLDGILQLLMSINHPKCDEVIAKLIVRFAELSDTILQAVLHHCLNQNAFKVRIETAVLVLFHRPEYIRELEHWLITRIDGKGQRKKTSPNKEAKFLNNDLEWNIFLPLLLFYILPLKKEQQGIEKSENCLKYICEKSWLKVKEWILEGKNTNRSNDLLKMLRLLLDTSNVDGDFVRDLFAGIIAKEQALDCNLYQLDAVECILDYVLKVSPNEKKREKMTTIFLYKCMDRLSGIMKNDRAIDPLKLKMLQFLEKYGKNSLRFKKIEAFSVEEFVKLTNKFLKSGLRFFLTSSQSLRVIEFLIKTIYKSCPRKLLLQVTDICQLILNHSKFLEIFLGDNKEALVDLLQTLVDLEPKCCNSSHVFLILGAYSATLGTSDQKLLRLLYTYETSLDTSALGSVLWGEAAIQAYQAGKSGSKTLWHEPNIVQVLDLLDSKLLLQSAKHFPQEKSLQPVTCEDFGLDAQYYDPSFLLPIFSFFMGPGCEVNCRRFIESSALAYTFSALTSHRKEIRQLAYQILSRFQNHLSTARFREKQQVVHLLHYFQNGITEANFQISSLMSSFMARALHIFFYPEDPLYSSVNSYMLQKAFMDLRDVPLFLSHLNNSDLTYRTERTWLLHLILDGLRDTTDYYILKKIHVFQQLLTLYDCAIVDIGVQKLILKIVHKACRHHAVIFDLCQNYGFISWLHILLNENRSNSDCFHHLMDILTMVWFTLLGQYSSREEQANSVNQTLNNRPHVPENAPSQLLMFLLRLLQSDSSLEIWSDDIFLSFTRLLLSLLNYQRSCRTATAKVNVTKQHFVEMCRIWHMLFTNIDIHTKQEVLFAGLSPSSDTFTAEKWFDSLRCIVEISAYLDGMRHGIEPLNNFRMLLSLTGSYNTYINLFIQRKIRNALHAFMTISDSTLLSDIFFK
ncbi:nucleolar pre-ribosomal-associated protein 1-like [Dendronephthya gigantea]|uniref:nucleolar pre-ribosomal-associated protein 1-like n=1 Tax=Dendronephthya gigantea TaxID=151771 RepID=UPI0010694C24|nr:nucleolar pre-ribosomal-associated protein 1-like [Dendronephthya gigantea]